MVENVGTPNTPRTLGLRTERERARGLSDFWRRYSRNRAAIIGIVIIAFLVLISLIAPLIAPFDPHTISRERLVSPNQQHWMGTDDLGRDILSGIIYGTRVILRVGIIVAIASTIIGITVGALAGFYGGIIDSALMRLTELFQVLPSFFLALAIVAITGPGLNKLILVISILSWPATARLIRVQYYSFKEKEFVEAARALGQTNSKIMIRHILPNAVPPAIVTGSLVVAQAILLQAGLSFFGLGDPTLIDWGQMINNAQRFLNRAWWLSAFPGAAIFLAVVAFNLVGDGLNDALNPRMRER